MNTLSNTADNNAKVKALKKIHETKWVGNTTHNCIDKCLTVINIFSGINSGWYNPKAVRISGLQGIYMINEDGSLFCECRVIKDAENIYRIEYMIDSAFNEFEKLYVQFLNQGCDCNAQ